MITKKQLYVEIKKKVLIKINIMTKFEYKRIEETVLKEDANKLLETHSLDGWKIISYNESTHDKKYIHITLVLEKEISKMKLFS